MNQKNYVITALAAGLVAIAPVMAEEVAAEEAKKWENSVDFGLSLSKGNTDNLLLRFGIQTEKKEGPDAYFASGRYPEVNQASPKHITDIHNDEVRFIQPK